LLAIDSLNENVNQTRILLCSLTTSLDTISPKSLTFLYHRDGRVV